MADLQYEKPCLAQDLEMLGDRGRGKGRDFDQFARRALFFHARPQESQPGGMAERPQARRQQRIDGLLPGRHLGRG